MTKQELRACLADVSRLLDKLPEETFFLCATVDHFGRNELHICNHGAVVSYVSKTRCLPMHVTLCDDCQVYSTLLDGFKILEVVADFGGDDGNATYVQQKNGG